MSRRTSGSGLFLTELILVILFFSVTAAVYVQVFVRAYTLSDESVNLTEATLRAQNMAESFYGLEGDIDRIEALYPEAERTDDSTLVFYYDSYWSSYPEERKDVSFFRAVFTIDETGYDGMKEAHIRIDKNSDAEKDEIYSLDLSRFMGEALAKGEEARVKGDDKQ